MRALGRAFAFVALVIAMAAAPFATMAASHAQATVLTDTADTRSGIDGSVGLLADACHEGAAADHQDAPDHPVQDCCASACVPSMLVPAAVTLPAHEVGTLSPLRAGLAPPHDTRDPPLRPPQT